MKKILITGGTGFFGKNAKPYLENKDYKVYVSGRDYDLTNLKKTQELFLLDTYDYIWHGACLQGAGEYPLHHSAEQIYTNSLIHINALEAWRLFQPQAKFIGLGSSCSYPGHLSVLNETDYLTGKLHNSVEFYGLTKILMQQGIEAYKKQYGLLGTTVIFATLYGPYDDFDLSRAHVVSALIKKFVDNKDIVEIWGDGTQTRELIFVLDQIESVLIAQDYNGPLINMGTGGSISIKNLVTAISNILNYKGDIVYNTNKFVGIKHKVLNIDLAKNLYNWTINNKLHSLEEGLIKTIEYYKSTNL